MGKTVSQERSKIYKKKEAIAEVITTVAKASKTTAVVINRDRDRENLRESEPSYRNKCCEGEVFRTYGQGDQKDVTSEGTRGGGGAGEFSQRWDLWAGGGEVGATEHDVKVRAVAGAVATITRGTGAFCKPRILQFVVGTTGAAGATVATEKECIFC